MPPKDVGPPEKGAGAPRRGTSLPTGDTTTSTPTPTKKQEADSDLSGASGQRHADTMVGQIPPIDSTHPSVDICFLGSLLWSPPDAINRVLAFVHDDDLEHPGSAAVLAAIRTLAATNRTAGPQLVLDRIKHEGHATSIVAERLWKATLSGAESAWRKDYGAAVVAQSLRRRVESSGVALVAASREAAEADLAPLVAKAAATIQDCAERLAALRGETS
jgi:hypothetical protein